MYEGGGLALARELFADYGIHNVPCLLIPPEASGWFRGEIRSVADFEGLRMRFFGLGAKVMQKLGVQTVQLPPGEIPAALQSGSIDAAEFSLPVIDLPLKLHAVAKYYYFPGWHQQATFFDLYINKARWSRLSDSQQEIIESACGDTIRQMIAVGEARQWQALNELRAQGVQVRRWAPEILVAFEAAWRQVASEESQANPSFRKVNASYEQFRSDYAGWRYVGYLQ
jgi:TRAP-type mannitol/chloroaromatic compound transport system substrate-binding protein